MNLSKFFIDRPIFAGVISVLIFVAGKEGKADFREVTLGQTVDGQRVVLSGLAKGERVIVDGTQHVMPGALIQAQEVSGKVAAK